MRVPGMVLFALWASSPLLAASPALAQQEAKALAREHFERGVAAFNERRFGVAVDEFEAAYSASPAFAVLYNIGQVDVALGRSVQAVDAFERYLAEGGAVIPGDRRREVQAEIERQRAHIATLAIRTVPSGAQARVDGTLVGISPLVDVRVSAGHHAVEAVLSGYATQILEIDVAGATKPEVELKLEAIAVPSPQTAAQARAETALQSEHPAAKDAAEAPRIAPSTAASSGNTPSADWRIWGYAVGGAGVAAIAAGAFIAADAAGAAADARSRMGAAGVTGPEWDAAKLDYDAAKGRNEAGWITLGVGAAAVLGGAILLLTGSPNRTSARFDIAPWAAQRGGGMSAEATW